MKPVSLVDVASYLPENRVAATFFADPSEADGTSQVMFNPPAYRHHVSEDDTAVDLVERAAADLIRRQGAQAVKEVDILITHTQLPDVPLFGCGGEVAQRLGIAPRWQYDLHNGSCAAFVHMIELATNLLRSTDARTALICGVQNAAGRLFAQDRVRTLPQAPIPGDGAAVGLLTANNASPILGVKTGHYPESAGQMGIEIDGGRRYWEEGEGQIRIGFTDSKIREVLARGKKILPELVTEVCEEIGAHTEEIDLLVTNQPNRLFLRSWRESLGVPVERHPDTFEDCGNLFGVGVPVTLDRALRSGTVRDGSLLMLSSFAHAGDYVGAAAVRWHP